MDEEKTDQQLISDAVYIINQVQLSFVRAEKLEERIGKRVKAPPPEEMLRVFLPQYLRNDSEKFLEATRKRKKR